MIVLVDGGLVEMCLMLLVFLLVPDFFTQYVEAMLC